MSSRAVPNAGHDLARSYEQLRLRTYDDHTGKPLQPGQKALGVPTIGWGNTRDALPVRNITVDEAEALYEVDAEEAVRSIYQHVPRGVIESLPPACYAALFSFVFNTGPQVFGTVKKRTQFYQTLMTDLTAVPAQMRRWNKDNGKVVKGLVNRREAEAKLWTSGLIDVEPATHEDRIVPQEPKAAINQGPMVERPAVGAVTTSAGVAGAVATETAQSLNYMQTTGHVVQIICLVLVLAGMGLTIWALVKQSKAGRA